MGAFDSFRKAYGALKDSTKVGLAKVNSDFKHLDIAIVKATSHVERPPKDRHVKKIISATSAVVPRADVAYCIHALYKRLSKTKNWIVAIKTLIVFHRALREGDPSFREELLNYSQRGQGFQISNFKDDSSPLAWDCSAWVRTYGMFLEERLECYRMLKYDIETECCTSLRAPGLGKGYSRIRIMNGGELLEQLPAMQQLLYRLIGCQPEGAAYHNYLVQYALALVLKESFKIYCSINDGIINLIDLFFDMPKHEAVKALNIYKKAGKQADYLAEFYDYCRHLDFARNFQFPMLRQPPPSFLVTMEEYVREAPSMGSIPPRRLEYEKIKEEESEDCNYKENDDEQVENKEVLLIECDPEPEPEPKFEPKKEKSVPSFVSQTNDDDLLGLNQIDPKALEGGHNDAMALGIVQRGNDLQSSFTDWNGSKTTPGWELALVEKNNDISTKSQSKLGGRFDKFLLDKLYEDEAIRRRIQVQNAGYNTSCKSSMQYNINPFDQQPQHLPLQDQFMMLHHQQQQNQCPRLYQQPYKHQEMLVLYDNRHDTGTSNPFGDAYEYPQSSKASNEVGNHGFV